jgi:hypothetical protein
VSGGDDRLFGPSSQTVTTQNLRKFLGIEDCDGTSVVIEHWRNDGGITNNSRADPVPVPRSR